MENPLGHPAVDIQVVEAGVVSPGSSLAVDPLSWHTRDACWPRFASSTTWMSYMFDLFFRTLICKELNLLLCALFLASLFGKWSVRAEDLAVFRSLQCGCSGGFRWELQKCLLLTKCCIISISPLQLINMCVCVVCVYTYIIKLLYIYICIYIIILYRLHVWSWYVKVQFILCIWVSYSMDSYGFV